MKAGLVIKTILLLISTCGWTSEDVDNKNYEHNDWKNTQHYRAGVYVWYKSFMLIGQVHTEEYHRRSHHHINEIDQIHEPLKNLCRNQIWKVNYQHICPEHLNSNTNGK